MSNTMVWISLAMLFAACVLLVLGIGRLVSQQQAGRRVRSAMGGGAGTQRSIEAGNPQRRRSGGAAALEKIMHSLSQLSVPEGGWQDSALKLKFLRAGFRDPATPRLYYAVKTVFTLVVPALVGVGLKLGVATLATRHLALAVVLMAALGYYLPDAYLRMRTAARAASMRNTLPDLIDLLVICTESGLGMDSALNRVSQDIARSSRPLAEEFYLTALEIRAGAGRANALRNLALRVDLEDVSGLVSMLIQADKFGTSLADSLRIQSDAMRVKRMQRAEEMAAKIPVKMLIPLVLFVFPALLAVLIGPAMLQVVGMLGK